MTTTGCLPKAPCMFAFSGHPNSAAHSSLTHLRVPVMAGLTPVSQLFLCSDEGTGEASHSYPLVLSCLHVRGLVRRNRRQALVVGVGQAIQTGPMRGGAELSLRVKLLHPAFSAAWSCLPSIPFFCPCQEMGSANPREPLAMLHFLRISCPEFERSSTQGQTPD